MKDDSHLDKLACKTAASIVQKITPLVSDYFSTFTLIGYSKSDDGYLIVAEQGLPFKDLLNALDLSIDQLLTYIDLHMKNNIEFPENRHMLSLENSFEQLTTVITPILDKHMESYLLIAPNLRDDGETYTSVSMLFNQDPSCASKLIALTATEIGKQFHKRVNDNLGENWKQEAT